MLLKFAVILLLAAVCINAEEETPQNAPQTSSMLEAVLCYVSPTPWNCVKEQTGRMLNQWEDVVEEKRHELMVEADEEMKESETSRGLSDEEKKQQPSELLMTLEKGFSAIANIITDEVNAFNGRESRAVKKEQSKDVIDDANDFNDDYSLVEALKQSQAEGNITEGRAKKGNKNGAYGGINDDDEGGYGGYGGYRGKGKKGKKHKKGIMKMFFLAAIVKSKIELLLKVLSFHLQLKFFAIALVGLVINLARFWIDIKKTPQKVVYVEHAQHQHHYDDHDDWGSSWKRQTANQDYQQDNFAHRLAYNSAPQYPQQ